VLVDHDFHPDEPTVRLSPVTDSTFGVDLFTDVLVRQNATSYVITDQDEFREMLGRGVISAAEGHGAERGLRELLELIEAVRLLRWLGDIASFGPCQPPPAQPMQRGPVPGRLRPGTRRSW
jgi:hypothetical protein